ncbi:S-layer homology domain-containing protein [Sporosarcina highlanderae]|uniref:S-layer homology domain-containing protein n=1 Tax=Sporosarcina highlanderae TaxID=3035916 RepID=A0ABT8JLE0_9BACL|nr:S-layer homology domain-containing protein [Sporosarcina highlanderae]MDN4605963.1 S-layer homology domain-containing protein [Sporosarcina highlanderae]
MKKWLSTALLSILLISASNSVSAATFNDVSPKYWAYPQIEELSAKDIISGYNDGSFKPGQPVTRGQAAKIIGKALKLTSSANFTANFTDVPRTHFAYNEIQALAEKGIIANSTKFNPNDQLSRAQMAKIIVEGFKLIVDDNNQVQFIDVRNDYWHGYIITLAETEISQGVTQSTFAPQATVTRAQLSAFIGRALEFDTKREVGTIYYDTKRKMYMDKSKPEPLPQVIDVKQHAVETINLVNKERKSKGIHQLSHDLDLSKIAQTKAEDMAKNGYFDHTSPTYGSVGNMLATFNYTWSAYGENIAMGYRAPGETVTGWINSSGHYQNMMNTTFTNIGSGYAKSTNGTTYWVHIFSKK